MVKRRKTHSHKKQHFVPQCYTRAWVDPDAPAGPKMSPYVWVFDQDGSNSKRKGPANIFAENDIYTIERDNDERDLHLEHGFQELEDKFTRIRNLAFNRKKWPDAEQMAWLFGFVATAQIRTQASRDHHRQQWANIRKRMEVQQQHYETASASKKIVFELIASPSSRCPERGITLEDVRAMEEQPIQNMVGPVITSAMGSFAHMHVAVLCTDDPTGFITSDQPCTWFDPDGYKMPPIHRSPGLANRTIEVTLPISPRQCLIITHSPDYSGYIDVPQRVVDELNRRHIGHCNDNFISCRQETKPVWFEQRPMPEDSWEMVHRASGPPNQRCKLNSDCRQTQCMNCCRRFNQLKPNSKQMFLMSD